ncbi:MAG TPA: ATP-binding protein [Ktedonobacteraceae bacterium]|nr:ATP-binding protein [Ktedonobacteraceae bacterium]
MQNSLSSICGREAGFIVGETSPLEFTFVSSQELLPPRLEYLVVPGVEEKGGTVPSSEAPSTHVDVLAQVVEIGVGSAILSDALTYDETMAILRGSYAPQPKMYGKARVIGYLLHGVVRTPRCAAIPGSTVYIASDALLQQFFSADVEEGVEVGTLINRQHVPVLLDPNGLRRHLAIIAQTGAGKSYLAGKFFESLLQLGATILVFDPNSDYVQIRKKAGQQERPYHNAEKTAFADDVRIYRIPEIQGRRFPDELIGNVLPFTVRFADLSHDEIAELAGISERATNQRRAIELACERLQREGVDYRPGELITALKDLAAADNGNKTTAQAQKLEAGSGQNQEDAPEEILGSDERRAARKAAQYIEDLRRFSIWNYQDIRMQDVLQPQRLTVLDLAGADKLVAAYAAERMLRDIWKRAITGQLHQPVFIVLEEAHNLIPANSQTRASRIINTIAAEGRKFRVFLTLITQRPSKINPDTLSQCGSQIIMQLTNPDDQRAVQRASEAISAELLNDLPGLNKGEAIVLGQLTRIPVMVRITGRASAEGGSDVDIVDALKRARRDVQTSRMAEKLHYQATAPRQQEEW